MTGYWLRVRGPQGAAGGANAPGPVLVVALVNPDGKPVSSASVQVVAGNSCRQTARSDSQGHVRISGCAQGATSDFTVDAAGLARSHGRLPSQAPAGPIVVKLAWAALVVGHVRDDRGQLVAKGQVTARRARENGGGQDDIWSAITDDTGLFTFDTLPSGKFALEVSAPLHETTVLPAVLAPSRDGIDVVLPRTAAIAGRVLGADGKPAGNAEVVLAGSGVWPPKKLQTTTDGTFRIEPVPEGIYELRATRGDDLSEPVEGISVDPGALRRVDLRLHAGARLRGRVLDAQTGRGLAGVHVRINEDALSAPQRAVDSDASGSFTLACLRTVPQRVSARLADYVVIEAWAHPGDDKLLELTMLRAGTLEGSVVDEDGQPIAGAELEVHGLADTGRQVLMSSALGVPLPSDSPANSVVTPAAGDNLGVTAGRVPLIPLSGSAAGTVAEADVLAFRTDAHGAFHLSGLPPGSLRVAARKAGFAPSESSAHALHAGETLREVQITLSHGGSVAGRVVDAHDAPLEHVRVELLAETEGSPRSTVSDQLGAFRFSAVRGPWIVTAYPPGLPPVRANATLKGSEEQTITLRVETETVTLEGRVLDGRARPIENATISLRALQASTPFAITVLSGDDGRFQIEGLPAPPYRISADHSDYAPSKPVKVATISDPVEIVLASGSSLHGAVIDAQSNEPISGARVSLSASPSGGTLAARSRSDGTFEFLHVTDGQYMVLVEADGAIAERREVPLGVPEPDREETFVLTPAGGVSGEIVDRLGAPVWNAEVSAGDPPDWSKTTRTDHAGHFQLTGLAPGDVVLSARHASAGSLELGARTHVYPRQETPGTVLRLPEVADEASSSGGSVEAKRLAATPTPGTSPAEKVATLTKPVKADALAFSGRGNDVVVTSVPTTASAARLGLELGDVLLAVDGEPVRSPAQARGMVRAIGGAQPMLEVRRGGTIMRLRERKP